MTASRPVLLRNLVSPTCLGRHGTPRRYFKGDIVRCKTVNAIAGTDGRRAVAARAASVDGLTGEGTDATDQQIRFGIACSRGPREEMEDELCVIPDFEDGLYAGAHVTAAFCLLSEYRFYKKEKPMNAFCSTNSELLSSWIVCFAFHRCCTRTSVCSCV
jgi:hypothetical protein